MSQAIDPNNQPQQAPNPFDGFFKAVGGGVQAATTAAQQANLAAGRWLANGQDQIVKGVQNNPVVQQVENGVTNGANQIGKAIGNQPVLPPQLGGGVVPSPTVADTFNAVNDNLTGGFIPGGGLLKGNATPASLAGGALFLGTLGDMKGNPEEGSSYPFAKEAEAVTSPEDQATRQIRFKGSSTAPAQETNAHSVLDRLGIHGDANTQLGMFPQVKNTIYGWIKSASSLAKNPENVPISDVKDAIATEVKKQFGSSAPKGKELDTVISDHMNNVYDNANLEQQAQTSTAQGPQTAKGSATGAQTPSTVNPYFNTNPTTETQSANLNPTRLVRDQRTATGNVAFNKSQITPDSVENPQYATPGNQRFSTPSDNNGNPTATGDVVPKTINTQSIYNMKVAANNSPEVSSGFDKIRNGNASDITDQEKIALAARDAYDKVITQYHPDVKTATKDLSVLNDKNVYKSIEAARFKQPDAQPNSFQKFFSNPMVKYPLEIAGVGSVPQIPKLLGGVGGMLGGGIALAQNAFQNATHPSNGQQNDNPFKNNGNQPSGSNNKGVSNDINHGQTISQNSSYVNDPQPDQSGYYHVATQPKADPNFMTTDDYQKQLAAINPYDPAYSTKANLLKTQYDDGQNMAKNSLSGEKTTFMQHGGAQFFLDAGNKLKDEFAAAPPNLLNNLKGYSNIQAYLSANPKAPYQNELTDIGKMNTQYTGAVRMITGEKLNPDDQQLLQPGDSPRQTYIKWENMMKYVKQNYDANLAAYLATTSGQGSNDSQSNPVPAKQIPLQTAHQTPPPDTSFIGGNPPPLTGPSFSSGSPATSH